MSLHRSLKTSNSLERHRNVLTRAERIEKLKEIGLWSDDSSPLSLPKIGHRKASVGKKDKAAKKTEGDEEEKTASEA